ncbi:MAG: GH25 family lysozyme [Lachnospiraceae bacterium]|nr:GH25 family lysozyme [Lachnospiraceae bacterium]MEE3460661.1 GH25 family lysozyme [Lachnospiraceae bacterium]
MLYKRLLLTIYSLIAVFTVITAFSSVKASAEESTESIFADAVYYHSASHAAMNIINGIDVSKYQKDIDWTKAKAAGVEYAFIRIGNRFSGSGAIAIDSYYEQNMKNAALAGVRTGVYFFSQAVSVAEAEEEAQFCIDHLQGYTVNMPVAIDFESVNGGGRMFNAALGREGYTEMVSAFCDKIASAGYTPCVYANMSDLTVTLNGAELEQKYKIWLANYTSQSKYAGSYSYWQYTSKGSVDGITGNVDCNFFYTSTDINEALSAGGSAPGSGNTVKPAERISISKEGEIDNIDDQVYTGEQITPEISLTVGDVLLTPGTDYTAAYSNNVNVGKATVKLTGINAYKGTLTVNFDIIPDDLKDLSVKTAKKYIKLSWNGNSGCTGFQIQRKRYYDESFGTVKTIKSAGTLSYKDTNVQKYREYSYRVRGFAVSSDGSKVYTSWKNATCAAMPDKITNMSKKLVLMKTPGSKKKKVTVPKGMNIIYNGITYRKNGKAFYHFTYENKGKSYSGYVRFGTASFKMYKRGAVSENTVILGKAAEDADVMAEIPAGRSFQNMGTVTDEDGNTWTKVRFSDNKEIFSGYILLS